METSTKPKAVYIKGYWRNKEDEIDNTATTKVEPESKAGQVFLYSLIAYCALLLFTPGWVIGLPVVGTVVAVNGVHKLLDIKNHYDQNKIVINYNYKK